MNYRILHVFILFLLTFQLHAEENGIPLYFPPIKNNIQPLPQKFEYSLRDAYRFLLGNRIIDTSQFEFQIVPLANTVHINMKWPANIFEQGNLSILNPSGVSVWSTSLEENQNTLKLPKAHSLVSMLMGLSFFKFCISQYELNTGMEICSPELVAKGAGSNMRVDMRPYPNKPRIQINGRSVTRHGIVFLNDEKESLSFRAFAASGAEFKMDTRSIQLDFVDVVNLNDNLMAITIKGPLPLAPSQYKIHKNDTWTVTLKKDRALIYVVGAGRVPLRQEFVVQGDLPSEHHRLFLEKSSPTRAYASSLELFGWASERGVPQANDSASDVAVTNSRFSWSLKNLAVGQNKESLIKVVDGSSVFTASYPFSRALDKRIELFGGINTAESGPFIGAEAQMWLESLPFLTRITQQQVGLGLTYTQELSGDVKTIIAELDLYWRLKRGLQLLDPSFYLGAGIQNITFDSKSIQTLAPFIGWMGPSFKKFGFLSHYFAWQEFNLKQSLPGNSGTVELKSRTEMKWKLYRPLKDPNQMISYSLGIFSEDTVKKRSGALLGAAWAMSF